ncbi:MAG TPA: PIN domain-containing protein [Solirubrobacterales bacterium]|nr:PIN domain-containing protein [Solirubrobacterales bacterium]
MIVLDASVLIAHLDGRDPHHDSAVELLRSHSTEFLGASQVSVAETLVGPARAGRLEDAWEALERLAIRELPFSSGASPRLASLRVKTGLKLPDCCVLLAAENHYGGVASFDRDLCRSARDLGIPVVD